MGHIFVNPVDSSAYMALLWCVIIKKTSCINVFFFASYKNGSMTRERIRDECSNGNWTVSYMLSVLVCFSSDRNLRKC